MGGGCSFECPGDLLPLSIGPNGIEDCACPPNTRAVHSFDKCEPCQYQLDGSGDCPCPDNQIFVYDNTCKPCADGYTVKDGKCCFNCPENTVPMNSCPRSLDGCACSDIGSRRFYKDKECKPCSKRDSQGYCIADWCKGDLQCPVNSKRIPGLSCYDEIMYTCQCDPGYEQIWVEGEWGCKPCPQGQKLDGRGRCVQDWCDNKYVCPLGSFPKDVDVDCFDSFDYCECFSSYYKDGEFCRPEEYCTWCLGWPWFYG